MNSHRNPLSELERLEQKRRRINQHLAKHHGNGRFFELHRAHINTRFDQKEAQLKNKLNEKQQEIITAALELLLEEGLNSLSLRDIARRIGLQAPALYWYFKNKEVLIDHLAEAILQKEFSDLAPRPEDQLWPEWLIEQMNKLRTAMLAYPDGGRIVAGAHMYPTITLGKLFETTLLSLNSAGIELHRARHITMTTVYYVFGFVIEEQSAPNLDDLAQLNVSELTDHCPTMMKAIYEAHQTEGSADHDFLTGLEFIVRGSGEN